MTTLFSRTSFATYAVPAIVGLALVLPVTATAQGIEEITVTARKRDESLIKVPVAITAISGETLDQRGVRGYAELNDFVPGLRYENAGANRSDRGFHTITMRGMFPGDSPNRQGVTAFVDGVPIPGGAIPGLTNLERVEVVNGPQSAYFGRSTFAGAINFITRAPGNTFQGSADASYGTHGTAELNGAIEGPVVSDRLTARLSARYYETDGKYDNFGRTGKLGARETTSGSATAVFTPTEDLKIRAYFTVWEDSDGAPAQAALNELDYNCNPGGNARQVNGRNYVCGGIGTILEARIAQNTNPPVAPNQLTLGQPALGDNFVDRIGLERHAYQANITADYDFNDYTLSGSLARNQNNWAVLTDTYNRPPEATNYYSTVLLPYDIDNWSGEARLASPQDAAFKFMIGANHYFESIFFQGRASRPPVGSAFTTLTVPTDFRANTNGVFGSASYDLTEDLTLNAEARYQWDKITHIQRTATGFSAGQTFKSFSPRVILNYDLSDTSSAYLSYARGTRPGTFNINFLALNAFQQAQIVTQFAVPLAIPEEKLTTYEAGLKGDFLDRRLRLLSAIYYGEWRDRQINQNFLYLAAPGATTSTSITLTLANGSVNLWGLESQATLQATDNLTLDATFNWAETDIRATSCAECVAINGVLNPVGNRMERYPAYTGTFGGVYEQPVSGDWTASVRADAIYTGKQYDTAANIAWTKPTWRFNARMGISNEAYAFELYGKNIFNDKTPSNIIRNSNPNALATQGLNLVILAPPEMQTFGAKVSLKY
jgi:iron complex outermembrane recepter protein